MTNSLKAFAKKLRNRPTDAEKLLWKFLQLKQLEGLKFRRQHPIDHYIVDFICLKKRLVVEVDGGQHSVEKDKDIKRDSYLKQEGFKILRFWNNEVLMNTEGVLEVIRRNCL